MAENITLCGANSYTQKYYLNEQFARLPEQIRQELQILCVLFVEDVGGVLTLEFNEAGDLMLSVSKEDADYLFDDIGSELKIRQIQREKEELLKGLETYYKIMFLKMTPEELELELEDEEENGPGTGSGRAADGGADSAADREQDTETGNV